MSIITLPLAKEFLKVASGDTSHDDLLTRFVSGITAAIEDYKHEVIEAREITERLTLCGRTRFRLWEVPVLPPTPDDAAPALISLISLDGATTWDVSTAKLDVDPESGLVEVITGTAPTGRVRATYRAGYDTVPERYVQGALVTLQHLWETQRGAGQAQFIPGAVGQEEARDVRFMYTFPRKAREWFGVPRPVIG